MLAQLRSSAHELRGPMHRYDERSRELRRVQSRLCCRPRVLERRVQGDLHRRPQQLRRRLPRHFDLGESLWKLRHHVPEPSARHRNVHRRELRVRLRHGIRPMRSELRRHANQRQELWCVRKRLQCPRQRRGDVQRGRL